MAVAFVQLCSGTANVGGLLGTATGTFPSNITAGNVIVVAIGNADEIDTSINTITDTQLNSYTFIGTSGTVLNNNGLSLYYSPNITGGTDVIKVAGSSPFADQIGFIASEYSGVSSSPFDLSAFVDNKTSNAASGLGTTGTTATTTSGTELLFSAFAVVTTAGTATAGANETMRGSLRYSNNTLFTEDQVVTATGAYAGTITVSVSKVYDGGIATFKAASAVGGITYSSFISLLGVGKI